MSNENKTALKRVKSEEKASLLFTLYINKRGDIDEKGQEDKCRQDIGQS